MVKVGRFQAYCHFFHVDCQAHLCKNVRRNIITLVTLFALFTYVSLYTWQWYLSTPASVEKISERNRLTDSPLEEKTKTVGTPSSTANLSSTLTSSRRRCDVLASMTIGKWVPMPYTNEQMDMVKTFIRFSRDHHKLPSSLERIDGLCGNVTFGHLNGRMHDLLWFRALCDPEGPNPCCFHNVCTGQIAPQDCRCPDCYDMRQQIHAEFANWVPSDTSCHVEYFYNKTDICGLVGNMTILMVGDSFIRHVYIALTRILEGNASSTGYWEICGGDYLYLQSCAQILPRETRHCGDTTSLRFLEYPSSKNAFDILHAIRQLFATPNSYVVLGMGIHDDFDFEIIAAVVLRPLLELFKSSQWPKPIWMSMHAPGLLKTPRVPSQSAESIMEYNKKVRHLLQTNSTWLPILDFYQLTKGVMSFDGAHYGSGVNHVKAQIFLNYILEKKGETKNISLDSGELRAYV